jgi:hypothetical protein
MEFKRMKAYVIFKDTKKWWGFFLKKGFGHCFLVLQSENKHLLQLDPLNHRLDIQMFHNFTKVKDITRLFKHCHVVELETDHITTPNRLFWRCGAFNCVNLVKHMLGVKCFAMTPYQLYKRLKKEVKDDK